MNENPPPAGPPPEPESPNMNDESPTRESVSDDPEVHPPEPSTGGAAQNLPAAPRQGWVSKVWGGRARRDQQLQTLQSGYVEMLDMMRSISNHLDRQAYNQDQLMKTLDHFPEAVDGLRNVGKATQQQTEVLAMVRSQLEANSQHEHEIVKSMAGFNRTLNLMDETNRNTTATIGDLVDSSRDAEDELRGMLERSEKRLTLLTGILGVIGLAAIGGSIYLGLSQRQSAPPQDRAQEQHADPGAVSSPFGEEPSSRDADETETALVPSHAEPDPDIGEPALTELADGAEMGMEWIETEDFATPGEDDVEPADAEIHPMMDTTGEDVIVAAEIMEMPTEDAETEMPPPAGEEFGEPAGEEITHETEEIHETSEMDAKDLMEETEDRAAPPLQEPATDGDPAAEADPAGDASEEPAGVKNVVRQFFSFLGDEDVFVEADTGAPEGAAEGGEDTPAE